MQTNGRTEAMLHCSVGGTFQLTMETVIDHSTRPGNNSLFDIRQSTAIICGRRLPSP